MSATRLLTGARPRTRRIPQALEELRGQEAVARAVATLAGGALVLTALAGCARPHVFGLRHDRAFTYGSLDSGSIAVGGVTSITGDAALSPSTRGQFESLLTTSL